jgi:L-alanine-DL-glutamate epimerase-like enolase superfamily enzyme
MEITDLKSTIVTVPFKIREKTPKDRPHYTWSIMCSTTEGLGLDPVVLVEVFTNEGIVGLGEAPVVVGPEISKEIVDSAKPLLLKEDPFDVERVMRKIYNRYGLYHFHQHVANYALNAIEMALWDIIGKTCRKPLYKIWGGAYRKKIPVFGDVRRDKPEIMAKQAEELLAQGFKTLYTKVGIDPNQDVESVKVLRDVAGSQIEIRVDANQCWSPGGAVRIIKKMERYDIEMIEQPVLMYDLDGMARVRKSVNVPICTHESSWSFYEVLNIIKKDAADVIQLDPRFDGGLMKTRMAAAIAEAAGLPVVMHTFDELGVGTSAYLHVIASCPNFIFANQNYYYQLSDDVIKGKMLTLKDGFFELPEEPGLGVELAPEKVEKYSKFYEKELKGKSIPFKRLKWPGIYTGLSPRQSEDFDFVPLFPSY